MKHAKKISTLGFVIWFICAFFYAFEYFVRSSTNALYDHFTMTPYHFDPTTIALFSSSFYIAYVIAQLPAGIAVDRYGVKRIMIFGSAIFTIALLILTYSSSPTMMLLARALAGFGGGFAFLCALKAIAIWLPERLFAMFTGLTQLMLYTGATLSALPLVITANYFSISEIFLGMFVISGFMLVMSAFVIRTHPDFKPEAKANDPNRPTLMGQVKGMFTMLGNPQILLNGFYCFTIYGTTVLFADLWGIRYLTVVHNYTDIQAGFACSMIFIGVACCSPIWGTIATIINRQKILLVFAAFIGIFIVLALLYVSMPPAIVYALCFLFGGVQSVHVLNYSILRSHVPVAQIGIGLALVNLFIPLSGAVLQPISGVLITHLKTIYDPALALQYGLVIIPILMALSLLLGLIIKDAAKKQYH